MTSSTPAIRVAPPIRAVAAGTLAFAVLGAPDGGTGVAWPFMRADLHQPLDALGLTTVALTAGAVAVSVLSGRLTRWLGVMPLLVTAATLSGLALAGVAISPAWATVVVCFLFLGAGGGVIDSVVQAHVVSRHGLRSMSAMHAGYGAGVTVGPLLVTGLLAAGAGWRASYACMAALYGAVVATCVVTAPAWRAPAARDVATMPRSETSRSARVPGVALSLLLFFLVTGMELAAMLWSFTFLTGARSVGTTAAGVAVGGFSAVQTLSRIALAARGDRFTAMAVLRGCCIAIAAGAALMWALPGAGSIAGLFVAAVGLGGIYPSLMVASSGSLATERARHVVGYQVAAANLGAATGSALTGVVLVRAGIAAFPVVLLVVVAAILSALQAARGQRAEAGEAARGRR